MKRSEMISLMCFTYGNLHRGGWSEATEMERMEEVLKKMEEAGMLPPKTRDPVLFRDRYEWEKE